MLQTLARNWWAVVLRGVFAVLFGLGAFLWPGLTLAVLVLLIGGYLFIDGILAVLWALSKRREGAFSWEVFLVGLASLAAGVLTLFWPGVTAIALLYLIAAWAIIHGIFEILAA
ncbi:MAG: HdeD family acid-resistance protein, partial [Candidatus Rokuibacteriota bacterium]